MTPREADYTISVIRELHEMGNRVERLLELLGRVSDATRFSQPVLFEEINRTLERLRSETEEAKP